MWHDLTIVIPTLNGLEMTRNCLKSIYAARDTLDVEIMLIDNGSEDGTHTTIEREFPDVRLYRFEENVGVTAAWNKGLSLASSDTICISNNDIIFEPGCLTGMVYPLELYDWVGVTSPETYVDPDDNRPFPFFCEGTRIPDGDEPRHNDQLREFRVFRIGYTGWCYTFRREDFPEGFDDDTVLWYQDNDFLCTMLFKRRGVPPFRWPVPGKVPVIVPGARVHHVYQGSHDRVRREWMTEQIEADKRAFYDKWSGYAGYAYIRELEWGKRVFTLPRSWEIVVETSAKRQDSRQPLVSVIIPAYERSELLRDTLVSVVKQTYEALEVIVVDDGSETNLLPTIEEVLGNFTGSWSMARLEENAGPGIARRVGTELAQGDYIQYLDSDDVMNPEKIERQLALMTSYPDVGMSYVHTVSKHKGKIRGTLGRTDQTFEEILPHILQRMIWTTSSCLWRRSVVGEPERWKALYAAEDMVFDFIAGLEGCRVMLVPYDKPLLVKRQHEKALSAQIAEDITYQQEILKSYDLMATALKERETNGILQRQLAGMYAAKIMFFLVQRRYREVEYCIRKSKELANRALPLDARIAQGFNQLFNTLIGFGILRRWRWMVKLARQRLIARS